MQSHHQTRNNDYGMGMGEMWDRINARRRRCCWSSIGKENWQLPPRITSDVGFNKKPATTIDWCVWGGVTSAQPDRLIGDRSQSHCPQGLDVTSSSGNVRTREALVTQVKPSPACAPHCGPLLTRSPLPPPGSPSLPPFLFPDIP